MSNEEFRELLSRSIPRVSEGAFCPESAGVSCLPSTSSRCTWCGRKMPGPRVHVPEDDPARARYFCLLNTSHGADFSIKDLGTDPLAYLGRWAQDDWDNGVLPGE